MSEPTWTEITCTDGTVIRLQLAPDSRLFAFEVERDGEIIASAYPARPAPPGDTAT